MSQRSEALDEGGANWASSSVDRAAAFRAARRHSARVRFLKYAIIVGSALAVVVMGFVVVFDPFRRLSDRGLSMDSLSIAGSKVTMERPRLTGFRQDGRPYHFDAETMVQDLHHPNAFDLTGVKGEFSAADNQTATISADSGHYDNGANALDLHGDIHVKNSAGYEAFLQSAHIDFKSSSVATDRPVKVFAGSMTTAADAMTMTESGTKIVFNGHVRSTMLPTAEAKQTTRELKGTTQ